MTARQQSPRAWESLSAAIDDGLSPFDFECDDAMGATDCLEGCQVEPDGHCPHGYLSAARTGGVV